MFLPNDSSDVLAKGVFLECLEEFLLDGTLPDVPPALIQHYLAHLEEEGLLATIETSVVRLPIETLDLHQVGRGIVLQREFWISLLCIFLPFVTLCIYTLIFTLTVKVEVLRLQLCHDVTECVPLWKS